MAVLIFFSFLGKWRLYVSHLRIDEKPRIKNQPAPIASFSRKFFLCCSKIPVTYVLVCNRWLRLCAKTKYVFRLNKSTLGVIITRNLSSTHFRTPFYRRFWWKNKRVSYKIWILFLCQNDTIIFSFISILHTYMGVMYCICACIL